MAQARDRAARSLFVVSVTSWLKPERSVEVCGGVSEETEGGLWRLCTPEEHEAVEKS